MPLLLEDGSGLLQESGGAILLGADPPALAVNTGVIARVRDITDKCYGEGNHWESSFRKVPALASTQGIWSDLSSSPGNPKPNYYVGAELTATALDGTYGMYHGGDVSPASKHLHKILIGSTSSGVAPAKFMLCDYLMFYPLVDMDSTDEQVLTNAITLPRYEDGLGVQAMLVATNPYIGGAYFHISYTNSDGTAGQVSNPMLSNTATYIGTLVQSGIIAGTTGPFIRLRQGDRGIRSVESITFYASNGGLAALVLVKPLAVISLQETTAFAEWDFLTMKGSLPKIYDGAYLNMLCCPNGSFAAAPIVGSMTVIWN